MKGYYISDFLVNGLWGNRNISFPLYDDVNIIIGPNASGKTTIINLLQYTLTGNIRKLSDYLFTSMQIKLKSFDGSSNRKIEVSMDKEKIRFQVSQKVFEFPLLPLKEGYIQPELFGYHPEMYRRHMRYDVNELRRELEEWIKAVWLPVSRRLPISEEDEEERRSRKRTNMESVDECLSELTSQLQQYRTSLDSELSELRKNFQKHALENILYDKRHDRGIDLTSYNPPTENEKTQLMKAFTDIGFLDAEMEKRISEHFLEAEAVAKRLKKDMNKMNWKDVFIIPLIGRTKAMVEFAQELENKRKNLFSALTLYENTIKSFISDKKIEVTDKGQLSINNPKESERALNWRHLSSGEKQILILLTQALLWEKQPVIYVADEPELSLHVTWQEKLLKSLKELAGQSQIIVATHSPDIAGAFNERVIDLARI